MILVLVMVRNEVRLLWGMINIMFVEFLSASSRVFMGQTLRTRCCKRLYCVESRTSGIDCYLVNIYDMMWYDMIRHDIWYYIWHDMIWYDMIWYDTVWCDMIYNMICDVICDMIYDIWYDIFVNCNWVVTRWQ